MVEAAEKAISFSQGKSRKDLDSDEVFRLALTEHAEIVGEAAKRIDEETRRRYPKVPGIEVARMSDRLALRFRSVGHLGLLERSGIRFSKKNDGELEKRSAHFPSELRGVAEDEKSIFEDS